MVQDIITGNLFFLGPCHQTLLLRFILVPSPFPKLQGLSLIYLRQPKEEANTSCYLITHNNPGSLLPTSALSRLLNLCYLFYACFLVILWRNLFHILLMVIKVWVNPPKKTILYYFNSNEWGFIITHNEKNRSIFFMKKCSKANTFGNYIKMHIEAVGQILMLLTGQYVTASFQTCLCHRICRTFWPGKGRWDRSTVLSASPSAQRQAQELPSGKWWLSP